MFVSPAYAQAAGPGGGSAISSLVMMAAIFGIMYFLVLRPQQKRMKQHREMVSGLKRGDLVVTQGGLIGKITDVKDEEVSVEIAQGVKVRVVRSTVAQTIDRTPPAAANS
ncbi:preprotein translocase subunit YajC [Paracoccus aerodenitrificans]|uniref:preprotein translocase subunit YajC n=1 Tax=Paracoccus aerodenitrificans TaxID=3017781 RepID=UPI0022F132D6|nr:preprotein translocase subunit YajC [Paracoccus aerodenitrificans]WBU63169.1 preprotein translocase subunit YajC [Paracoccus aerodenitrificans]